VACLASLCATRLLSFRQPCQKLFAFAALRNLHNRLTSRPFRHLSHITVRFSFVAHRLAPPPDHLPASGLLCFLELKHTPHCDDPSHGFLLSCCHSRKCRNTACCFASFSATPTIFQVSFVVYSITIRPEPHNWRATPKTIRLPIALSNYLGLLQCHRAACWAVICKARLPLSIGVLCSVPTWSGLVIPFMDDGIFQVHISRPSRRILFVNAVRTGRFISLAGVQVCTVNLRSTVSAETPFRGRYGLAWMCLYSR